MIRCANSWAGRTRAIYDEASQFLQTQGPNFSRWRAINLRNCKALLEAPDCFKGNQMKEAKTLLDGLKKEIDKHIKQRKRKMR